MVKPSSSSFFARDTVPSRRITNVQLAPIPDTQKIIAAASHTGGNIAVVKASLPLSLAAEMFSTFSPDKMSDQDIAASLLRLGMPSAGWQAAQISPIPADESFDAIALAKSLASHGRSGEAEALLRQALAVQTGREGLAHKSVFALQVALSEQLVANGDSVQARRLLVKSVEAQRTVLGTRHPMTLSSLETLALMLLEEGELRFAEPLLCEAVLVHRNEQGDAHPDTLRALSGLALLLIRQGKPSEAEPLLRRCYSAQRDSLGSAHVDTFASLNRLAECLEAKGNIADAESLLHSGLRQARKLLGEANLATLNQIEALAAFLLRERRPSEARLLLEDATALASSMLPTGAPARIRVQGQLGACLARLESWQGAEGHLMGAYEMAREYLGLSHLVTQQLLSELISLYVAWGKPAQAAPFRAAHAMCS